MSTHLKCPRCSNVIQKPATGQPVCPACSYPGPDTRGRPGAAVPPVQYRTAAPAAQPAFSAPPVVQAYDAYGNPVAAAPPQNGMATAGLVLGIIGVVLPIAGIVGIILAAVAKKNGQPRGKTALVVAIACTVVGMILGVIVVMMGDSVGNA